MAKAAGSGEAQQPPVRERLILAGIDEINQYGIQNFSVRRVATVCGVSCAAPYKHFKDKSAFFAAIILYINDMWSERHARVLRESAPNVRARLVSVSMEYIRFLVENPHFRSVIMLKDEAFDKTHARIRGEISASTRNLIGAYCQSVDMPPDVRVRKTFVVRSLIYGASLLFDNGELAYTEENLAMVAANIDREFDLP